MENVDAPIGNPITLLIERISYFGLGCFFLVAFIRGLMNAKDEDK